MHTDPDGVGGVRLQTSESVRLSARVSVGDPLLIVLTVSQNIIGVTVFNIVVIF